MMAIKGSYAKQTRTSFTLWAYYILMSLSLLTLEFTVLRILRTQGEAKWVVIAVEVLFGLALSLCTLVACSDPGYLKRDTKMDFVTLLDTISATSLCPDCKLIRTPRSRHCYYCLKCVDRFDHHCPWVNNCIGKGNFAKFYTFVVCQLVYLVFTAICIIMAIKIDFSEDSAIILQPMDSDYE